MAENQLEEALGLFAKLEELEQAAPNSDTQAHEASISELISNPLVFDELQTELIAYSERTKRLDSLRAGGHFSENALQKRERALEEMAARPSFRLASRFLGASSVAQTAEIKTVQTVAPERFFERSPEKVAEDLVGLPLEVGKAKGTIVKVLPQTEQDNANWIDRRPIFGTAPVDAYVAPFRGNHMLFLRTAPNTCVRIDRLEIDEQVLKNPGQVCKALGLNEELSGSVVFDGKVIKITVNYLRTTAPGAFVSRLKST